MQEYGGTDRRGSVDRRSGWDRRKSKQNLNLLEMLTTHDIDGQCRKITIWLKQHYNFQGIGFLLRDPILSRPRFYADNVSEDILKGLNKILPEHNQTEETQNEADKILNKKLEHIQNYDEIKNIIRYTISEIAKQYPDKINDHIFIRRLSRNFDLEKYRGYEH